VRLDTINYVGLFRGRRGKLCVMVSSEKIPVIVYCEFVLVGVKTDIINVIQMLSPVLLFHFLLVVMLP
jgi:hypothetical protein